MTVNILYEDDNLLVVDKPHGLVVTVSETTPQGTLQDELKTYLGELLTGEGETESEFVRRCGIVHRLDKDTSGVLLVAKNSKTFENLQALFKSRKISKEYCAVVFGQFAEGVVEVNAPVKRDPKNARKYAIAKNGREALTKFELISSIEVGDRWLSVLRVYPLSGRTHQIRVHALALNHVIVGDELYSSRHQLLWAHANGFERMLLHAHKITLNELTFESELPPIFKKMMKQ